MEDKEKITWVIGDIHGMYDALRVLVDYLDDERLDKFVFVGDYIDHGPSTKEVLDLIMGLGDKAVTLIGNHEHLLLDTLYNEQYRKYFGERVWEENGARSTIRSFNFGSYEEFEANIGNVGEKYIEFLKNLRCFYTKTFSWRDEQVKFLITHAGVMPEIPVEEQLAVKNYDDLTRFMQERNIWVEDAFTWVRGDFLQGDPEHWKGYVVIHGHTPTHLLDHYVKNIAGDYDSGLPYLRKHPDNEGRAVSINIDTGAAFGNRLTALGVSEKGFYGDYCKLYLAQLNVKDGYYRRIPIKSTFFDIEI